MLTWIFKHSRGLGALIAEKFAAENCNLAINYIASQDRAEQVAEKIERVYKTKPILIQGVCLFNFHPHIPKSDLTASSGRGETCRL